MQIVLVGYMASGKSTIGRLLAKELNYEFIDLDVYIENYMGNTISEIFKEEGEVFFRKLEHQMLIEVLDSNENILLATGGGVPCYSGNMDVIVEKANAVYLKLSIPSLVERIIPEKEHRPLVKNIEDELLSEFIGKHLFERSHYYSIAQNTIVCDKKTPDEIVSEIETLFC